MIIESKANFTTTESKHGGRAKSGNACKRDGGTAKAAALPVKLVEALLAIHVCT